MTQHKIINESFKSIFNITIPILLTTLSSNLMYVTDRTMLAGYSINAMNAAALGGYFVAAFTYIFIGIANTAEIFVGQYNGAKEYDKMSNATWQMIYLAFLSIPFLLVLGYFSNKLNTFPEYLSEYGVPYQKLLLYFGFLPVLISALSSFFIGQGKTNVITCVIVSGSILNALLDYIFIYKLNMGSIGTAVGTVIAETVQTIILAIAFFSENNRSVYKTLTNRYFNAELFKHCITIGIPMSLGNFTAIIAWYLIQAALAYTSSELATVYGIGSNIYILFLFIGEGLHKAIATISSNMIGQRNLAGIRKTYKRFIAIIVTFGLLISIPLLFFQESVLGMLDILHDNISSLYEQITISFKWIILSIIFESLMYITWGVLFSGGDTKYPVTVVQICLWGFVVIPTWFLYSLNSLHSAVLIFILTFAWSFAASAILYIRYKSLKWYNKLG